jgi:hypothetical protein
MTSLKNSGLEKRIDSCKKKQNLSICLSKIFGGAFLSSMLVSLAFSMFLPLNAATIQLVYLAISLVSLPATFCGILMAVYYKLKSESYERLKDAIGPDKEPFVEFMSKEEYTKRKFAEILSCEDLDVARNWNDRAGVGAQQIAKEQMQAQNENNAALNNSDNDDFGFGA